MNTTRTGTFRVTVFAAALAFVLATVAAEPPKAPATKAPKPLSPAEAAAKLVVPAGFRVSLFAGEPDVAQPIGITFVKGSVLDKGCLRRTAVQIAFA